MEDDRRVGGTEANGARWPSRSSKSVAPRSPGGLGSTPRRFRQPHDVRLAFSACSSVSPAAPSAPPTRATPASPFASATSRRSVGVQRLLVGQPGGAVGTADQGDSRRRPPCRQTSPPFRCRTHCRGVSACSRRAPAVVMGQAVRPVGLTHPLLRLHPHVRRRHALRGRHVGPGATRTRAQRRPRRQVHGGPPARACRVSEGHEIAVGAAQRREAELKRWPRAKKLGLVSSAAS